MQPEDLHEACGEPVAQLLGKVLGEVAPRLEDARLESLVDEAEAMAGGNHLEWQRHHQVAIRDFAVRHGIVKEAEHFCDKHKVATDTAVQVPGSLMSYRDPHAMLECLFYVNELPGGEAFRAEMNLIDDCAAQLAPVEEWFAKLAEAHERLPRLITPAANDDLIELRA